MLAILQAGHACSFTGWTCLQFYRLDMLAILQAGQWTCWQFYRLDMLAIYRLDMLAIYRLRLQIQSQVRIKMESMFRIRIKTSRLHHSGPHQGWEFALLLFALSLFRSCGPPPIDHRLLCPEKLVLNHVLPSWEDRGHNLYCHALFCCI